MNIASITVKHDSSAPCAHAFFEKRAGELCNCLVCRGYNRDFVEKEIERARRIPRVDTLSNKQSAGNERIPFVVTFHPVLPNIGEILRRLHPTLQSSSRCREAVGGVPMVTFRRPKCQRTFWFTQNLRHRLIIRLC